MALDKGHFAYEHIGRNNEFDFKVTCKLCDVYVVTHDEFLNVQSHFPFTFFHEYSVEKIPSSATRKNITLSQDIYFVVMNREERNNAVTYILNSASLPTPHTPAPTPIVPDTLGVYIAVAFGITALLVVSGVCVGFILCVRTKSNSEPEYMDLETPQQIPLSSPVEQLSISPSYQYSENTPPSPRSSPLPIAKTKSPFDH